MGTGSIAKFKRFLIGFGILPSVMGCEGGMSSEALIQQAQRLQPLSPVLNDTYQRSCRNCHTIESTGAPLTGDKRRWATLIDENGHDGLIQNVINGKGGMPPFGLCMECDIEDFQQLISFMAQQ